MRRLLLTVALLACVASAQTLLHQCSNSDETANAHTSMACTLTVTGGTGHGIVVWASYFISGAGCNTPAASASDTASNTFTLETHASGTTGICSSLLVATNVSANASDAVTAAWSTSGSFVNMGAAEFGGVGVFDAAATPFTAAGGAWTSPASTTVTTTASGDLLFGYSISGGGATGSAGSGFTGLTTATGGAAVAEYGTGGAAGSNTVSAAYSDSSGYVVLLGIAMKASSPPPATMVPRHGASICCRP
jgi:hypothetical protein